jgi:hypothetical protein
VNSTLEKEVKAMYSKRRIILALTFLLVLTIPFAADGLPRTIWGEIQGLNPSDRMDVHLATEPDFVLIESGSIYHLLPNLPRDVKVRYVGESVIVTGDLHPKDNSILVDKFEAQRGMFRGIVWTKEMQQQEKEKAGL